jgi:hypothetical protein
MRNFGRALSNKGVGRRAAKTQSLRRESLLGKRRRPLHPRSASYALHLRGSRLTARKIREARDFMEVPIAVENVSS